MILFSMSILIRYLYKRLKTYNFIFQSRYKSEKLRKGGDTQNTSIVTITILDLGEAHL